MIVIVDYGVGNTGAMANMLEHIGFESVVSGDPDVLRSASKLILPGVGAFDRAMDRLRQSGLASILTERVVTQGIPVLGVCLGMQLLTQASEEGVTPGLGWIRGRCRRIDASGNESLKVPHIGWANVQAERASPIFPSIEEENRFYFVHSYHVVCEDPGAIAAIVRYGGSLTAAVSMGNVHGVQFHPEKSHRFGMRLLQRFIENV